jgi:membrane protease subunit (stomatin/prohibitin family)
MVKCPLCEHEQEAGDDCENCGMVLPKPAAAEADPAEVLLQMTEAETEEPRAYACPHCHQPTTEVFCPECAIRVRPRRTGEAQAAPPAAEERAYICPECQQPTTEIFCPTCAIRVRPRRAGAEQAAAPDEEGAVACKSCGKVTTAVMCPQCGVRVIRGAL